MHGNRQKNLTLVSLVNFTIVSLGFTVFWVFLYTNILDYLNKTYPTKIPAGFIRLELAPEPFEIPLYIILTFLTILIIKLIYRPLVKLIPSNFIFKGLILIALLAIFFNSLGNYPLAHDVYPYTQTNQLNYLTHLLLYFSPFAVIFFETAILEKFIHSRKILLTFFFLLLIAFISILTFEPRFPILGLDYSYFYGAIWEIANGKTIFSQISSQYGFLSIIFFALLYKLQLLAFWHLPLAVWILYVVEYFLCFLIIYKVSRSLLLAITCLFSIITINYFSIYLPASTLPQIGPLRWISLIIPIWLLLRIKKIDSKLFLLPVALLSFWVVDNGISLILGYLFTLILLNLFGYLDWQKAIKTSIQFFFCIIAVFIVLNLIHIFFGFELIDLKLIFIKLTQYAKAGYGMIPMPTQTYFWLVMLVYFASIIYIFKNSNIQETRNKQYSNIKDSKFKLFDKLRFGNWDLFGKLGSWNLDLDKQLLLFSANISFFSSLYYLGRSHPSNLFVISPVFIVNLGILLGIILSKLDSYRLKFVLISIIFILLLVFPAYNRQEIITNLIKDKVSRYKSGSIFKPQAEKFLKNKYEKEITLIKKEFKDKKILILSDDDAYILALADKITHLYDNPQVTMLTSSDVNFSLRDVYKTCPKKMIGDCRLFGRCTNSDPFVLLYAYIQPNLFQKIQDVCKIKYEPKQCTKHLCVAVTK